jgi:ATP-binding cassette subfamily B protein
MSSIPTVEQRDVTDCGAACLKSVASHYDLEMPVARIRQFASTDEEGTNIVGMVEASEELGFMAKGVRGTLDSLNRIPLPAIAHVVLEGHLHHFVVIYEVDEEEITFMNPDEGRVQSLSIGEFDEIWTGVLVLLLPDEDFEPGDETTSISTRLWQLIRPHTSTLLQALVGAALYTIIGLSTSIYVQQIVDNVLPSGNIRLLNLMSVVMLVLLVLQIFVGSMKNLLVLQTGQQIDGKLILGFYKHVLHLPQRFFDSMRTGEIMQRLNDALKIRRFINDVSISLIVNVMIVVFSFGLMFLYSWQLALIMLGVIPFYGCVYYVTNRINRSNQRALMQNAADLESQLVESLNSISAIKRFGLQDESNLKTETRFVGMLRTIYRSGKVRIFSSQGSKFSSQLFTILMLWIGGHFVINRQLSPGQLMSFYSLLGYLTGPVSKLIGMNKTIQNALIAADRLFEIMDLEQDVDESKAELTPDLIDDIHFEDVAFRYGSRERIFDGLNLTIHQGETTAVVGESGSGKSTLVALIQRLYELDEGHIRIGDLDVEHVRAQSLRRHIGTVPQEVSLFSGNVIDNIAVGDYDPDMHRVLELSRRLGISEFVEDLPEGYHTDLGENGTNLSGGQKQRIAMARALYRDPEIIILDEATAALDSASERRVQRVVLELQEKNKTVITIAHRLSTILHADRIVVLKDGAVAESGTHEELIDLEGVYYDMWQYQTLPSVTNGSVSSEVEDETNEQIEKATTA